MPVLTRSNSAVMERFRCAICQDLLIEPVSVTCGHTFCRLCLAKWTLQCLHTKCAQCQTYWTGQPHVNIVLRDTIKEQFLEAYEERAEQHAEESEVVKKFDLSMAAHMEKQKRQIQQSAAGAQAQVAAQNNTNAAFIGGVIVAAIVALVVYILGFGPAETYVLKPVKSWSLLDSIHWLENMGDWTKETLLPKLASKNLDGRYLDELAHGNSIDQDELFSSETEEHKEILLNALKYIAEENRVPPTDLWQYKDVYPLKSLVQLEILYSFPRLGTLLMFLFDYKGSFLPVIHLVTGDGNISVYDTQLPEPSWSQYMNFGVRLVVFPLFTIYTKFMFLALWSSNTWAMLYCCARACLACTFDVTSLYVILKDETSRLQTLRLLRKTFITGNVTYLVLYFISFVLPYALIRLVCSCFFYFNFLILPIKDAVVCIPILVNFVKYVRNNSAREILEQIKELSSAIGPIWRSLGHYLSHQFSAECKALVTSVYSILGEICSDISHYLRHQALNDVRSLLKAIWSMLKGIYPLLVRLSAAFDRHIVRIFNNDPNQQ